MHNNDFITQLTYKVVIIGSGPAGYTAALYALRAHLAPLLIEGKTPGGQLMGTTAVENWPGFKSILGPDLMIEMRDQVVALGCQIVSDEVVDVAFNERPFHIITMDGRTLRTHTVIIATGAVPRRLHVPGEQEFWGKGVTTCAVCDGALYAGRPIAIIGGGDTAMEDATFMARLGSQVTVIQLLDRLTASAAMQQKALASDRVTVLTGAQVREIQGSRGHVTGVVVDHAQKGRITMQVDAVFLAIGTTPAASIFQGKLDLEPSGHIKRHSLTSETSIQGVFVAGDVADTRYRQAITSAGFGCMAALDAQRYLEKNGLC